MSPFPVVQPARYRERDRRVASRLFGDQPQAHERANQVGMKVRKGARDGSAGALKTARRPCRGPGPTGLARDAANGRLG